MLNKDMDNIFIDLTSKNNHYNCLESQGSWLFHRFGKRNFLEEEINFNYLKKYLQKVKPKQITLYSVLGDPFEYSRIFDLLFFCKRNRINVYINTNGYSKKIKKALDYNLDVCIKTFGYTKSLNTIVPDQDSKTFFKNLKLDYKNNLKIQYMLYEQNLCDVIGIIEFCESNNIKLEFIPGSCVGNNINHIIDKDGKWLYDISGIDQYNLNDICYKTFENFDEIKNIFTNLKRKRKHLGQTLEGYHFLKNYVKNKGISILDVSLPKINKTNKYNLIKSISFKGHLFDSLEEMHIITNAYIPDWLPEKFNTNDFYQKEIYSTLCEFANSSKKSIMS